VAVSCTVVPGAIEGLPGLTEIETNAGNTVMLTEPLTEFMVAVIETAPLAFAVSSPLAAMVITLGLDELQFTAVVMSFVVLSL
jgi:hypothetical protein